MIERIIAGKTGKLTISQEDMLLAESCAVRSEYVRCFTSFPDLAQKLAQAIPKSANGYAGVLRTLAEAYAGNPTDASGQALLKNQILAQPATAVSFLEKVTRNAGSERHIPLKAKHKTYSAKRKSAMETMLYLVEGEVERLLGKYAFSVSSDGETISGIEDNVGDLVGEGALELSKSIDGYCFGRGYVFRSYAIRRINRVLLRALTKENNGSAQPLRKEMLAVADFSPDKLALRAEFISNLNQVLMQGTGGDRRFELLMRRFGFNGLGEHTLADIGAEFHVTRERIRQLEAKALAALKESSAIKDFYNVFVSARPTEKEQSHA